MAAQTVMDNEFATVWFHPEKKIVHHMIKKFVSGKDLRDVLDKGYEVLKRNAGHAWLSDDRNNGALTSADEQWAKTDWFPRVVSAGWKYWAIVMPEKVIGQLNMKRFVNDYAVAGITAKVFSDPNEALKWLESQQ